MTQRTAAVTQAGATGARSAGDGAAAEFERIYRANVEAVTAYFARRSADPHVVADLTADTFVTAIASFGSFDPGKGTARAWVFGIARHVYAVTKNPDGTVTLAVYQSSGIAAANARLRQLGDQQVVVVPVQPGCPSLHSLPGAVPPRGVMIQTGISRGGSITVQAQGIPPGDILVVGVETTAHGTLSGATLTSPPPPSCVSLPALAAPPPT